jgi:hypothetical protein
MGGKMILFYTILLYVALVIAILFLLWMFFIIAGMLYDIDHGHPGAPWRGGRKR